jgi:hypothetical protein
MAKTNKSFKKVSKKTSKRKTSKLRKIYKPRKSQNYINIDNTGLTKVIYTEGNQSPKTTVFKWDGNYDGKNADIHMNLDVDGKKTKSNIRLSNDDLMKIISANVVDKPIDQRLQTFDEDISNIYSPSSMMILSQKPQMMSHQSTIPVFIDEMPEPIIFDSPSPSPSPSKKKKLTKAKR